MIVGAVGIKIIDLDGVPVAVSKQTARKAREEIEFFSKEAIDKCLKALNECREAENNFPILELDSEIPDHYSVEYSGQLLDEKGIVNGREAKCIRKHDANGIGTEIDVEYSGGEIETIPVKLFMIPLYTVRPSTGENK